VQVAGDSDDVSKRVFRREEVTVPESGDLRVDFAEVTGGTDVIVQVLASNGSRPEGWPVLLPGRVKPPTDRDGLEALGSGIPLDFHPDDPVFRRVTPGPYTLMFLRPRGTRVQVYTQPVDVTEARAPQLVRVTLPEQLPSISTQR
jgi:hypothetical protein